MSNYITLEGLEKLRQELVNREKEIRAEIADRIKAAKELGDLSENAEYSDAMEARTQNEMRISELKDLIQNAVIADNKTGNKGIITIGSIVTAMCDGAQRSFTIVGANEANPIKGFISNETPFGVAFMGRKKGETVEVETPSKTIKCKIKNVN
jgi:transcription elongation factor GreA